MWGRGSDLTTTLVYPLLGLKVSVLTPTSGGPPAPLFVGANDPLRKCLTTSWVLPHSRAAIMMH